MQFTLADEDLQALDAMEQEGVSQEVLDTYWHYLANKMGFDFATVVVTDTMGGTFEADEFWGTNLVTWTEFLGHEDGMFARFPTPSGDRIVCWTDGMVGIYRSMDAFDDGDGVMVLTS